MIKPQGMRMTPRSGGCAPRPAARAVTRGRGFHRGQGGDVRARGRRQGWGGRRSTGLAAAGQGRRVQAVCGPGASAQRKLPAPPAPALRDAVPAHAGSRTAPRGGGTRPRPPARPPARWWQQRRAPAWGGRRSWRLLTSARARAGAGSREPAEPRIWDAQVTGDARVAGAGGQRGAAQQAAQAPPAVAGLGGARGGRRRLCVRRPGQHAARFARRRAARRPAAASFAEGNDGL
jgi:hypothetical protein